MKRLSYFLTLPIAFFLLGHISCQKKETADDVSNVDTLKYKVQFEAFIDAGEFKVDTAAANQIVQSSIAGAQNGRNKFLKRDTTTESTLFFSVVDPVEGVKPVTIETSSVIKDVFNTTGAGCLRGDDKAAFRHMAKDKVPENLKIHTQDQFMNYYEGLPGLLILSHFQVKRAGGAIENYTLPSGRVEVSSILELINPGDANSYIYQMDCAGYFSFALSVGGSMPGIAKVNSAGQAAGNSQRSSIISYGKFASPLAIALKPGATFNLDFNEVKRKTVLQNILSAPSTPVGDNDIVIVNNYHYLLIASTEGSSGLNGKVDMSSSAGGTLGLVSGSATATAGMTYSKSVKFTDYNTYVSTRLDNTPSNETRMTGAQIRRAIAAITP